MTRHSLLIRDAEADVLREATHEEIIRAARSCLARRVVKGAVLQSPGATRDFILVELSERSHESFCVLYLDNRHRVLSWQEIFRGTIDGASVYPREVVKEAISRRAAACILVHNHPLCFVGGVTTPVIGAENHPIGRPRKNGMGSCPVSSDRITPVSPSRRLRCSRALARSSTRRVAVRPACDGCAAA